MQKWSEDPPSLCQFVTPANDGDDNDDGEHPPSRFQFIAPSLIHAGDSGSDGEYDGGVGDEL